jgi:hypothetical protein
MSLLGKQDYADWKQILLVVCFMSISSFAYSSALKEEAKCFSGKSVIFHQTTSHYIAEDKGRG